MFLPFVAAGILILLAKKGDTISLSKPSTLENSFVKSQSPILHDSLLLRYAISVSYGLRI
jgi:hypothetical protein